ncbi:MAG: hypothetical protein Q8S73_23465, partial [Deltaproteobacteria bacterium]|nr:hypothetical protein [Deltaproteobacteria bacterium]
MPHRRPRPFTHALRAAPLLLLAAGCGTDNATAADAAVEGVSRTAQAVISDSLHGGGTPGFLFLPPMVPRPAQFGDFVPTATPTVRVDELNPNGTTRRTLATFTANSGPGHERLRVHLQGHPCDDDDDDGDTDPEGYFLARWKTNNANLSVNGRYRVRVMIPAIGGGDREVGFADVDVVRNEQEFRTVDTGNYVPLVNGRVLRIKFRLDRPAVDSDRDGDFDWADNCPFVANANQLDTNRDGQGDACECTGVVCAATDGCHSAGTCNPTNGACSNPVKANGSLCSLAGATGACTSGVCGVRSCNVGLGNCDANGANGCETPTTTVTNCRACGTVCRDAPNATATCTLTGCGLACDAGYGNCDGNAANGCERSVATDVANCGACGRTCGAGQTCVAGACTALTCTGGAANCDGNVTNGCETTPATDVANCGACGRACSTAHATPTCTAGTCFVGACAAGFGDCDGNAANGCEVATTADVNHCGACGRVCALAHATSACTTGACAIGACDAGWADCDGIASNGCEAATTTVDNCGACGRTCDLANAAETCAAGACALGACATGFGNCDGNAANGCEADLTDPASCGACGHACPSGAHATPTCGANTCGLSCETGWADANHDAADGCELDVTTDANCGSAGNACTSSHGVTSTCEGGRCSTVACAGTTANCDGNAVNGCERDVATDATSCGACGHACSFPHAAPECTNGACGFSVCQSGWADCDGVASNGCEVDLTSDAAHCGACNFAACTYANGTGTCSNRQCALATCASGFVDRDHDPANGCEVDLELERIHAEQLANEQERLRLEAEAAAAAAEAERQRLEAEAAAAAAAAAEEAERQRLEAEAAAAQAEAAE